jgi:hypothetical protein
VAVGEQGGLNAVGIQPPETSYGCFLPYVLPHLVVHPSEDLEMKNLQCLTSRLLLRRELSERRGDAQDCRLCISCCCSDNSGVIVWWDVRSAEISRADDGDDCPLDRHLRLYWLHALHMFCVQYLSRKAMPRSCRTSGGQSPASHRGSPASSPGQVMCDLCWTKRYCGRVCPSSSVSPANEWPQ